MEKVRPWCGQSSYRGLKTEQNRTVDVMRLHVGGQSVFTSTVSVGLSPRVCLSVTQSTLGITSNIHVTRSRGLLSVDTLWTHVAFSQQYNNYGARSFVGQLRRLFQHVLLHTMCIVKTTCSVTKLRRVHFSKNFIRIWFLCIMKTFISPRILWYIA